jgi:hypothetical protein
MTLDVGKGQFRVETKLRSDGLKDVPAGGKSFVREFWTLSGSKLIHCLDSRLSHPMSVGSSGLLKYIPKRCKKVMRESRP